MNRTTLAGIALAISTSLLSLSARADTIEGVTVSPSQVNVNETVTITIIKSGPGECRARLLYGDGQEETPFDMANPGATFTHAYTDPGTYRVRARGAGVTAIQCANGPQDAFVSVRFGPIITPEGDEGLKPLQPKLETAPARGDLKPLPPTLNRDKGRTITPFPKITVHQFEPAVKNGDLVWAAPDILAPGGRLILGGEGFGVNPGNIYMWGLGPDPVILENAFWSGRQVHGILPASLGGAPGVRTPVTVAVYNSNLKKWSPGIELNTKTRSRPAG